MSIQNDYSSYIESIFQKSENGEVLISDEITESELEILYKYLNKIKDCIEAYIKQPLLINEWAKDQNISYNISEDEIREAYNRRIKLVLADLILIDEWYKENEIPIPGSQESTDRKKNRKRIFKIAIKKQAKKRAKREKQKYPPMRQTVSFDLLKKLEDQSYVRTDEDEKTIKHQNFKPHRTRYTKSKRDNYKLVTERLIKENFLSLKEFYGIIDCQDSDYYREFYKNSFLYECTVGKFHKIGNIKNVILIEMRIAGPTEKEWVFFIK